VRIRVLLFAQMAAQAGFNEVVLEVPEGTRVARLRRVMEERFPKVWWSSVTMVAVNQEYSGNERELREDDEVAIIPQVSGG
jgi:molybdopterin converting factor subunit 1